MKTDDGLIQVRELISILNQFDDEAWVELKHVNATRSYENIIEVDGDKDFNTVTIYFE